MPTYDYVCESCKTSFSLFLPISKRDEPCKGKGEPCGNCGSTKHIVRAWVTAPIGGVDKTLSPGSDFKEMMNKMAKGVPERYREGLHRAASLRGGRLGSQ